MHMITSDEVLSQLKCGKSIEEIGNAIAKVLNIANSDYIKYQKEEQERAKKEDFKKILYALNEWFAKYMPQSALCGAIDNMSAATLDIYVDNIIETFNTIDSVSDYFKTIGIDKSDRVICGKPVATMNGGVVDYATLGKSFRDLVQDYLDI